MISTLTLAMCLCCLLACTIPGSEAGQPQGETGEIASVGYEMLDVPSLKGLPARESHERFGTPPPHGLGVGRTTSASVERLGILGWERIVFHFNKDDRLNSLSFRPSQSHSLEETLKIIKEDLNIDLRAFDRTDLRNGVMFSTFTDTISMVQIKMTKSRCKAISVSFGVIKK